jgi:hypothetical protein
MYECSRTGPRFAGERPGTCSPTRHNEDHCTALFDASAREAERLCSHRACMTLQPATTLKNSLGGVLCSAVPLDPAKCRMGKIDHSKLEKGAKLSYISTGREMVKAQLARVLPS